DQAGCHSVFGKSQIGDFGVDDLWIAEQVGEANGDEPFSSDAIAASVTAHPRRSPLTFGIMKPFASISLLLLLVAGCVSNRSVQSDAYFLPCAPKASVSFEGETQAGGRSVHRLEVRRLAFVLPGTKEVRPTMSSCVIYYAGDEYGPSVLRQIDDCIDPLVRKLSEDRVEIYFLSGAHTHIRQRWSLLGHTARLETEEEISWCDDPRMPNKPDAANPAIASRF